MPRINLDKTTFDAALDRLCEVYENPTNRITVSFSAGKDSTVSLELAIAAATLTNRLPVDVVMRDDEIMLPGTFEYADRVARRPDVRMNWLIAGQPIVNVYNRAQPYFWAFDDRLPPDFWVRTPPAMPDPCGLTDGFWSQLRTDGQDLVIPVDGWANNGAVHYIPDQNIEQMVTPTRFPLGPDQTQLMTVIGLRVQESRGRLYGLYASGGHLTKPNRHGVRNCRPIYDLTDSDIWKAIHDNGWDYNQAYNTLHRLGIPRARLRIAPPTMNAGGVEGLAAAQAGWPRWFDRVANRCPGVRLAGQYGKAAITPDRRHGETWRQTFFRECVDEAPPWIRDRARNIWERIHRTHRRHANADLPEVEPCFQCTNELGCYRNLTRFLYNGDPFGAKLSGMLPAVEPEFFRAGAGTWGGTPAFA